MVLSFGVTCSCSAPGLEDHRVGQARPKRRGSPLRGLGYSHVLWQEFYTTFAGPGSAGGTPKLRFDSDCASRTPRRADINATASAMAQRLQEFLSGGRMGHRDG